MKARRFIRSPDASTFNRHAATALSLVSTAAIFRQPSILRN
jgi:hypothetical protein